jgi:large conductance mechanosensitive channel
MLKGFRDFILRGNVVDLAVAVIIGAAFNAIVTSFANDVLMQLVSATIGKPDFRGVVWTLHNTPIRVGIFLNAIVGFLIAATVIYFGVVMPLQWFLARLKKNEPAAELPPTTKKCPECLSDIPLEARRCAHCTQPVPAG